MIQILIIIILLITVMREPSVISASRFRFHGLGLGDVVSAAVDGMLHGYNPNTLNHQRGVSLALETASVEIHECMYQA